jgi:hypothetical protein
VLAESEMDGINGLPLVRFVAVDQILSGVVIGDPIHVRGDRGTVVDGVFAARSSRFASSFFSLPELTQTGRPRT